MNKKTKIALSATELELVCNKEWILTKLIIIEKVYQLFGTLAFSMQQHVQHHLASLPIAATGSNPKISRGENYRGLPYVMLDYPRHFTKEATTAIRTLFWWGNFFSINLLLSGTHKKEAIPALEAAFEDMRQKGYWVCIHTDPWQHHFEEDNYVLMEKLTAAEFATVLHREPFIKIASRIDMQQWDAAPVFLENHFYEMIMLLKVNCQGGEKGLSPGIPKGGSGL